VQLCPASICCTSDKDVTRQGIYATFVGPTAFCFEELLPQKNTSLKG